MEKTKIYELGTNLIELEEFCRETKSIVVTDDKHKNEILEMAGIETDAAICLEWIFFCKAEIHQEHIECNLSIPKHTGTCDEKCKIAFFVTKSSVIFIDNSDTSEKIINRIREKLKDQGQTKERFLYGYFVMILSKELEFLESKDELIMQLEDDVLSGEIAEFQRGVMEYRKELLVLREYYVEISDLMKEFENNENDFLDEKNLRYFGIISDRAERLARRAEYLIDHLNQVRETYKEIEAEKQNEKMNYLTILSAIFLPLTLVTGWFGMNFTHMPELEYGYPGIIFVCMMIVTIVIIIFKRKKIL